eukprot:scaffold4732_cov100-Skeletonema_marinoi.AAC.3
MSSTVYTHTSLYSSAVSSQCLHLQLEPHLRGPVVVAWSSNSNSNSDYNDGYTKGQNKANKIWENNYGSDYCYKISKYDTKIKNYISNNYDVNSYSDKYNFKKGAAAGMMDAMKQHDSECDSGGGGDYDNNDFVDIDSCSMVGQDMASQIAEEWSEDNCDNSLLGVTRPGSYSRFGNTQECITIANDDCMGMMDQKFKKYCLKEYHLNDYSDLVTMKGKCYSKVSKIIKNAN